MGTTAVDFVAAGFRRAGDYTENGTSGVGAQSLTPIVPLHKRLRVWQQISGTLIDLFVGDTTDYDFLASIIRKFEPESVVHFAEQRSAPYSTIDRKHGVFTQTKNSRHIEPPVRATRVPA